MVTTVKIAPIEKWCERPLQSAAENGANPMNNVGKTTRILTETMKRSTWCGGMCWTQEDSAIDELRIQAGLPPRRYDLGPREICEHMLEMD